jgi:hypothetical protein
MDVEPIKQISCWKTIAKRTRKQENNLEREPPTKNEKKGYNP